MDKFSSFPGTGIGQLRNGLYSGGDVDEILSSIRQMSTQSTSSSQRKAGLLPPRNFKRLNVQRLREIQRSSKQRELAKSNPVKALWQSKEYRDVPSTLSNYLKPDTMRMVETPVPRSRSKSHDRRQMTAAAARQSSNDKSKSKLVVTGENNKNRNQQLVKIPKLLLKNKKEESPNSEKNYDDKNRESCDKEEAQLRRASSTPNLNEVNVTTKLKIEPEAENRKHQIGAVPKYLLIRKKQWQEEEVRRQKEAERPLIPDGHELLDEELRVETLKLLEERYKSVLSRISSLPVCSDTLRVRRLKDDLESQMLQTEEAINIFSHAKVYIKNDS